MKGQTSVEPVRFDHIAKLFAGRRLSRRQALTQGGAGIAAASLVAFAAAGPPPRPGRHAGRVRPEPNADHGPTMLFLQAFQAGSVAPRRRRRPLHPDPGAGPGPHRLLLRPPRPRSSAPPRPRSSWRASASPTTTRPTPPWWSRRRRARPRSRSWSSSPRPTTRPRGRRPTRSRCWRSWERTGEGASPRRRPTWRPSAPAFGAAHLFIDDCPNGGVTCYSGGSVDGDRHRGSLSGIGFCWHWDLACCKPCDAELVQHLGTGCDRVYGCDQKYAPRARVLLGLHRKPGIRLRGIAVHPATPSTSTHADIRFSSTLAGLPAGSAHLVPERSRLR